ncbi:MAG: hypothetical protein R3B48_10470 [Kofleriaceae bacterium]
MGPDELIAALVNVVSDPGAAEDRAAAATALAERGDLARAQLLLAPLVNFTAHEEDAPLPCLCKACLPRAGTAATLEGVSFHRSFVVSGRRVLHFWMIDELAEQRREVRRAVGESLRRRIKKAGRA